MVGFHTLKSRLENQEQQTKQHQARLDVSLNVHQPVNNFLNIHQSVTKFFEYSSISDPKSPVTLFISLQMISQDLETLQHKQTTVQAKIAEYKRRHLELSHRVLGVMVRQETQRKAGVAIGMEEEQLRTRLEGIQAEVNAPTQMKVR